jgi:serine/threonine protein kinase
MDLPHAVGRYRVERLLGEGGMGRVLLARDPMLGRPVALKILRDDLGLPPDLRTHLVDRLRQEARAAAAISHPGIVTLHDMGEDAGVGLFLVFEWIDGPTLRERIGRGGPLAVDEVADLARVLGSALSHAHRAGVVHRDVKPENVMLSPTGPKLADFGIARLPDSTLTLATTVMGTPAYSAPEALASGAYGAMSDEFSLAATLYEALTGVRAFPGEDALAVATRVATGKHRAPSYASPALRAFPHIDTIFDRALAKDARSRFPSCAAFGEVLAGELESAGLGTPTPVPRSSIVPRATRRWQNGAILAALGVIGALVVAGRFQGDADGVSLRSVASAFAAVASAPRASVAAGATAAGVAAASAVTHRVHAPESSGAPAAVPSASAAIQDAGAPLLLQVSPPLDASSVDP